MTTDKLKALEADAKRCMREVASAENSLQIRVEEAMDAIRNYHYALGLNPDETQLCVVDCCPNIGDFERADGEYVCQSHYVP